MESIVVDEDALIARAAAAHLREGRVPSPCLKNSRMLELEDKVWVELRSQNDETIAFYKLSPTGQLRKK